MKINIICVNKDADADANYMKNSLPQGMIYHIFGVYFQRSKKLKKKHTTLKLGRISVNYLHNLKIELKLLLYSIE